jgi:hypothetical protein
MFDFASNIVNLIYSLDDSEFSFYGLANISDTFYGM